MASFLSRFFARRKTKEVVLDPPRRGFGLKSGVYVGEDSAMKVAAFYRGVTYISTQLAKLPWLVKDAKFNEIEDQVYKLLTLAPNPEMTAFSLRVWQVSNAIIHGNSYCEIVRNAYGQPIEIWPIPQGECEPTRLNNGQLVYRLIGGSAPNADVYLKPSDVFHVKNFHTKDGIYGQGVVAYAMDTLGISLAADQMAGNLFSNGGIPSGVLTTEGVIDDDTALRMKESWLAAHSGKKSGGVAILEDGTEYKAVNMNPDVMQFLDSRKFGVLEIARFLGLPPTKLFDTTATTFSNQENSNLEVATDTLDSWANNLELEANVKLLNYSYGGKFTELDLYAVFRGDMTTRSNYFSKMMQIGAMTPNEVRKLEGKSPYPQGDNFYIAVNNFTPVDRLDEVIDAQISKGASENDPTNKPADGGTDPVARAAIKFLEG